MIPFLAAIPGIVQAGAGLAQLIKGSRGQKNLQRPEYEMPAEAKNAYAMAAANYADRANAGGANYQRQAIDMAAMNALGAATQRGGGLASVSSILANSNNAMQQANVGADNAMQQRLMALMAQSQNVADYRDKEFQMNKYAPYVQKYNENREMLGAGMQNMFGGLNNLSSLQMMSKMMKDSKTPTIQDLGQRAGAAAATSAAQNNLTQQTVNQMTNQFGLRAALQSPEFLAQLLKSQGLDASFGQMFKPVQ